MTATLHLPDPLLARLADLRARGASWESAAKTLGTTEDRLRAEIEADRPHYNRLRVRTRRDVADEVWAEALLFARKDFRSANEKLRQRAYDIALRAIAAVGRARPARAGKPDPGPLAFIQNMTDEELEALIRLADSDVLSDPPGEDDDPGGEPPPSPGGRRAAGRRRWERPPAGPGRVRAGTGSRVRPAGRRRGTA